MLLFGSLYHGHASSLSRSGIRPTIPDLHRPNNDLRVGLLCQILRLSDFRFPLGIYRHPKTTEIPYFIHSKHSTAGYQSKFIKNE